MDPASIVTIVVTCYHVGAKVIEICADWKYADNEVEKRVIIVESCWDRTKRQMNMVERIRFIMDDELCRVMEGLLTQLSLSLSQAMSNLETVIQRDALARPSVLHRFRARRPAWVWKKNALDTIIADLEAWQRRFDPSWFLIMKIPNPVIDSELAQARSTEARTRGPATAARNPLALATGLRRVLSSAAEQSRGLSLPDSQMEWLTIPFSEAKAGRRLGDGDNKWYVVDTIEVGPTVRGRDVERDVRVLATKLSQADPLAFGLLNCKGFIPVLRQRASPALAPTPSRQQGLNLSPPPALHLTRPPSPSSRDYSQFHFVFRIPEGMEVLQSLRQLLLNSDMHISLSRKMRIARELSKAVNYVHTLAFVHKNVRPESILYFEDPEASQSHAFLVGFDAFRSTGSGTMMGGDMSWDRNVYRHPLRQGMDPTEKYRMQHDIYSLGVCLFEIGLWEPLVEYTSDSTPRPRFSKSFQDFQAWCKKRGAVNSFNAMFSQLKDYLVEQARTRLPPRMGDKYTQVVVSCLTCLDDDNEDFGGEEIEESDDTVAIRFIEKIMKSLNEISV